MRTWSTRRDRKEGKHYILHKQEVYSIRVLLHFVREDVVFFDLACPEVGSLFVFLYYIPHIKNRPAEVYLPEGDADRKINSVENVVDSV